ncbi:Extracellular Matrix protein PelC [hydrothermal vent metagenome]|uniref:Extracellular Matrix protein PelC n=1 Tax=hydrothermal vent metagenome TaxID=652676 RepID=A0A1W1BXZ7_9ZZZZ
MVSTPKGLPKVYEDVNDTYQKKNDIAVSVFRLQNFTDTPRAGMRAANIVEGILKSKGYRVISHVNEKKYTLKKAYKKAKDDDAKYFIYGGVSEWRYKTGIDGEPAVSLQISLYKTKNKKLVWSATGSDSDWGNGSIGTTAQSLMLEMMEQ